MKRTVPQENNDGEQLSGSNSEQPTEKKQQRVGESVLHSLPIETNANNAFISCPTPRQIRTEMLYKLQQIVTELLDLGCGVTELLDISELLDQIRPIPQFLQCMAILQDNEERDEREGSCRKRKVLRRRCFRLLIAFCIAIEQLVLQR